MKTLYLIYSGTSADGRGNAPLVKRTEDKKIAKKYYDKISKNPYNCGKVIRIKGNTETYMMSSDWED